MSDPTLKQAAALAGTNLPVLRSKEILDAAAAYATASKAESDAKKIKEALAPMLKAAMAGAPKAKAGEYELTTTDVAASLGTLITAEMVGTYVGGRAAQQRFSVKKV
jgi:hypothetical protein